MAAIAPNLGTPEWDNLGRIVPIHSWKPYRSFTSDLGTFRLLAFSFSGDYNRFCHLRIKYNLGVASSPLYSKWYKIYPPQEFRVWNPKLDDNLADIPKSIEVIDHLRYPSYSSPVIPISWNLSIDVLRSANV